MTAKLFFELPCMLNIFDKWRMNISRRTESQEGLYEPMGGCSR